MTLTPSNTMGQECSSLAAEMLSQPELLRDVFLEKPDQLSAEEEERVAAVQRYTGARSTTDEARMLQVGALRLLGASDREIARACKLTTRTIPILLHELERTGRLTAVRDRLVRLVADNAERSSLLLRDLMERGLSGELSQELAAMLKAAGAVNCFQVEKLQLLTGQATEIVEQRVAAGREEFERWWRESALPLDVESLGNQRIAGQSGAVVVDATPMIRTSKREGGGSESGGGGDESMH